MNKILTYDPNKKYKNGDKVNCYGTICTYKSLGGCSTCFLSIIPIDRRSRVYKECNNNCSGVDMCFVNLPQEEQSYFANSSFSIGETK